MRDPAWRRVHVRLGKIDPFPTLVCEHCGHKVEGVQLVGPEPPSSEELRHERLCARGDLFDFFFGWIVAALVIFGVPVGAGLITGSLTVGIVTAVVLWIVLGIGLQPLPANRAVGSRSSLG